VDKNKSLKESVARYRAGLEEVFSRRRMVVFLCGPALNVDRPGAVLRKRVMEMLEQDSFEVVLGEDDGLEGLRAKFAGIYAHDNELSFIEDECSAVVLIADSVGSFCELGLFAYFQSRQPTNPRDFILVIDQEYAKAKSYLREGPAKAIEDFGKVIYRDLGTYDGIEILDRLRGRRAVSFIDKRGRPGRREPLK
jgi:hypothetical protein